MPAILSPSQARPVTEAGGGDFATLPPPQDGDWRNPGGNNRAVQRYKLGVWIGMCGILMFFAALTSAMIVRQGLSGDWAPVSLPAVLYVSTAVLLASSFTIERARREAVLGNTARLRHWLNLSGCVGLAFLACQLMGWQDLAGRGLYLASNPANSFYYLLTAAHGLHLLGGIAVMGYVWARTRSARPWPTRLAVVEGAALYWHFLDALWIYILGLLMFWR